MGHRVESPALSFLPFFISGKPLCHLFLQYEYVPTIKLGKENCLNFYANHALSKFRSMLLKYAVTVLKLASIQYLKQNIYHTTTVCVGNTLKNSKFQTKEINI